MNIRYSLLFCFLFSFSFYAQNKEKSVALKQLVDEYNSIFKLSQLLVLDINTNKIPKNEILISNFLNDTLTSRIHFFEQNSYKNSIQISDVGLKWVSDLNHNFGIGVNDDEDVFYKSRISSGVDWVILGEGSFVKNKRSKQIDQIDFKKDSLELVLINKSKTSKEKIEVLKTVFDFQRLQILKKYAAFYKQKVQYTNNLYASNFIIYAEKLKVDHEYDKLLNQIEFLETFFLDQVNQQITQKYSEIPFMELNDLEFRNNENEVYTDLNIEILELQKEIYKKESKNVNSATLRTKFRYNFYNSDRYFQRNFASIGASLSIPITFKKDFKEQYKLDKIDSKIEFQKQLILEQAQKFAYDFSLLKLKQKQLLNNAEYFMALLDNEQVIFNKHSKNFSPEKSIEYTIALFQNQMNLLEINQKMVEYYISYYYLFEKKINPKQQPKASVATYLWKDTFNANSNNEILNILVSQNITQVLLSPDADNSDKLVDFKKITSAKNIELYRLISENLYVKNEAGLEKLLHKIKQVDPSVFSGIHLNIEPHTFADYQENKQKYIFNLNTIYTKVKQWCELNNLQLSVSIPMHLPKENAIVLKENNISAFIMAYENLNHTKLLNRTKELREILKDNYVWVFKLNDFNGISEVEKIVKDLKNNGINEIGYYDVSTLLNSKYYEN